MSKCKYTQERHLQEVLKRISITGKGCWEYMGYRDKDGYGIVMRGRRQLRAHRFIFSMLKGDPGELHVCHHCDNPSCVNPSHLFAGSDRDNTRDKVAKGRQTSGERQHKSKFSWEKIRQIRERYAAGGISQCALARELGVTQYCIWAIVRRINWSKEETINVAP